MENASKALIMAGGMLLAMLVVTLLIYAWNIFSDFQSSDDRLADIENTAKFNQQFSNYDRDDIQGYEIISLVNQIVDYNERKTSDTINENTEKYNPIKITIDMVSEAQRKKLVYANEANVLITQNKYEDGDTKYFTAKDRTNTKSSFEYAIVKKLEDTLKANSLDETKANKVAKHIGAIFHTEEEIKSLANQKKVYNGSTDNVYMDMANTYFSSVGDDDDLDSKERIKFAKDNLVIGKGYNRYYSYSCTYYEYMQFKRGVFECINLEYNEITGRVSKIDFRFTGKIH